MKLIASAVVVAATGLAVFAEPTQARLRRGPTGPAAQAALADALANIDLSKVDWSNFKGGPLSEYSYMNSRRFPPPLRVGYGQPSQMPRRAEITEPVFEMASGNFRPPLCEYCDDDDDDLGHRL